MATKRAIECPGKTLGDGSHVECGSSYYEAEGGYGDRPKEWVCTNCCNRTPRRSRNFNAKFDAPTRSQNRIVEEIKKLAERNNRTLVDFEFEFKDGLVSIRGRRMYGDGTGNGLNDSTFFAIITRRGKVNGSIYGFGSHKEFTADNLFVVGIY